MNAINDIIYLRVCVFLKGPSDVDFTWFIQILPRFHLVYVCMCVLHFSYQALNNFSSFIYTHMNYVKDTPTMMLRFIYISYSFSLNLHPWEGIKQRIGS